MSNDKISVSKGLINPECLSIGEDGTPVVTSAREQKHPSCDCASRACNYHD